MAPFFWHMEVLIPDGQGQPKEGAGRKMLLDNSSCIVLPTVVLP